MLVANAVVDTDQPRLQVGENQMDDRQVLLGNLWITTLGNSEVLIAALTEASIAAPIVSHDQRSRRDGALDEPTERLGATVEHDGEPNASGIASVFPVVELGARLSMTHLDGTGDGNLVVNTTAFPTRSPAALWGDDLPVQRCTVHKHRNLLGHAPKHMHDELGEDYRDMIYADTASEVETRRKAFVRKWRLKCRAVADSLAEAGDKLFTFTRLSKSQWKSARTTNAIERLNEEFKRWIKTQTVLPCPETVPMLLWALLASGQIQMRKVDGWETLDQLIADETLDRAA